MGGAKALPDGKLSARRRQGADLVGHLAAPALSERRGTFQGVAPGDAATTELRRSLDPGGVHRKSDLPEPMQGPWLATAPVAGTGWRCQPLREARARQVH